MDYIVQVKAEVRRVVDGDTFVMLLDLHNNNFEKGSVTEHIRLNGYGAPEKNTPEGKAAMSFVKTLLGPPNDKRVAVKLTGKDTFGRFLGDIYVNEQHLGEILVNEGHGHPGNKMGLSRLV